MKALQKYYLILAFLPLAGNLSAQTPPTLGNYPDTTVLISANTSVTPDATATGATSINVAADGDFKGVLVANSTTGVVRITNPHPAGTYAVTVEAFNSGGMVSKTFTLTVVPGIVCDGTVQFTNGADVSTSTEPVSVAIGDFNNDGKQDFAAANASADAVAIRLGNGLGGFSGTTIVSVGDSPRIAAIGDFNNDGNQDFATANFFGNTVSIRLGDGLGGFSGATELSVGAAPISLAIGDFNNDGRQDFACANSGAAPGTVSIRLGDGLGGFSGTTEVSVGANPVSIVIGDFNHDSNQDFASANGPDNTVSIRMGDGLGGFSGNTDVSVDNGPRGLAIGDFNHDGKQDFACANQVASTVSIRLGDGLGGFTGTTNISVGETPIAVAIGDFNNDGHQDFVTANFNADTASVSTGDGLGGFAAATSVSVGDGPRSVATRDFNGDGTQDFAAGNFTASTVSIRLGGCLCPPVITQSTSQAIIIQSLECPTGTNAYWRAFNMATIAGSQQYEVTSVSFGIESATGAGGTQPVTVRLHTTTNFPIGFPGSLTQIATTTIPVLNSDSGTVLNVPLAATVPAGTSQLVMEVFTPDSPDLFVIGSNSAPETGPGYHSCGLSAPRTAADLGFPNIHIVFNVFGGCIPAPTPTPTSTPGTPTPPPTPTPTATPTTTATPTATPESPTPTTTPTPRPATLGNISTRLQVGTGASVMIAGFIVQGSSPKRVLIRAAGPSLTNFGVPNALANPQLELHDSKSTIGMNNDWQTTQIGGVVTSDQAAEIQSSGLAPTDPLECAIIATLSPGTYTAIVKGVNDGTGVGIVEAYDLDANSGSLLSNISTRGFVQTGDDAMIGGFIVITQPTRVMIRAIGPSLSEFGVPDAVANPQLELHDATSTIAQNDDWQTTQLGGIISSDQVVDIQNSQLAPTNAAESAIIVTLQPGSYTAIVRGVNNTAGNALVEVYALQ